ncbi:hypothetical protein DDSR119_45 [Pseudomonas phage DDSR119]|nr:hypothetical protein DDSR119_45 [Pseudomonas phage DDSR119]
MQGHKNIERIERKDRGSRLQDRKAEEGIKQRRKRHKKTVQQIRRAERNRQNAARSGVGFINGDTCVGLEIAK